MAVVTSRRVAFGGREHRREWRYADLVGPAHHPDVPVTLLPDRGRLQGLLVPANAVVNFRFYLTLAAADDRGAVIAQVDELLAAHRAAPPAPLPLVDPDDAPLTAVRPDRRALGAAAVAAVVFVTLGPGALGPGAWGPRGPVPSAEVVALDVPRAGAALVPIGPVGPVAPRSRVGSADSAVWSPPNVPTVRPSAVSTVAEAAVVVALPPAAPPSVVPTRRPVRCRRLVRSPPRTRPRRPCRRRPSRRPRRRRPRLLRRRLRRIRDCWRSAWTLFNCRCWTRCSARLRRPELRLLSCAAQFMALKSGTVRVPSSARVKPGFQAISQR